MKHKKVFSILLSLNLSLIPVFVPINKSFADVINKDIFKIYIIIIIIFIFFKKYLLIYYNYAII